MENKVKKIKCYYAKITHKVEIVKKCHGYNDRIVLKSALKYKITKYVSKGAFYGIFSNFS